MRAGILTVPLVIAAFAAGCVENTAPGNDREAELEPPAPPAQVASAAGAIEGVATGLIMPEIMSDADQRNAPAAGEHCTFRMTRVGFPVLLYGAEGGVIKLNGKLVPLPSSGEGRYSEAGVEVTVRPLEASDEDGAQFPAELVLRLPGAPNELGFHGFAEC